MIFNDLQIQMYEINKDTCVSKQCIKNCKCKVFFSYHIKNYFHDQHVAICYYDGYSPLYIKM